MLSKNKKIVITTGGLSSVGQTGGVSSYSHDLATNLHNAGYEVVVYLIKENNHTAPHNVPYACHLYDIPDTYRGEEEIIRSLLADIEAWKPAVIINNDTSYIAGLWPVLASEIIKISVMHGFTRARSYNNAGIMGKMATVNHQYVDYIVCQNSRMVNDAIQKYNLPPEKVVFIPQTFKNPAPISKQLDGPLQLMFANGLNATKGAPVMAELSILLQNSTLDFKCTWCMLPENHSLQLDHRFETFGGLARTDFLDKLKAADIIIIPTKLDTGPMLVVEAMAHGVIPLCNNLEESAIPDLIKDGQNGFRISGNDPKTYFSLIKQLYNDLDLLNRMKQNCSTYYLNNLTEVHQVNYYNRLFKKNSHSVPTAMSDRNIIYYHRKKTSHLPIWSLKRLYLKLRYSLEKPLYK